MKEELSAGSERRLHGEYWAAAGGGAVELIAHECTGCGACYLPAIATCVNCRGRGFRRKPLSRTGQLYTYTIVRGSGGVWPDVYTIGYIDFPEKVRVCGQLRETDPARLKLGMELTAEEAVLYTDVNGTAVKCFRFHATEESR